ncbi:DUF1295 domain-containing protein [Pedobacter sp. HMF7647]|uniref:DUF1295 domain-containing protein n=1 Tax=Hufsiella arboris TaxID=2695275 RepID=A0A7K1YCK0_9SPHI|nr:DUF1295 domain-containing protein [Hufsiella arboris]MXV52303.1 DUF1295 domain-containing protein [Hufsiella arboris]
MNIAATNLLFYCFVAALLVTAAGFRKTYWFISVGYAFSVMAMALIICIFYLPELRIYNWFQNLALLAWGLRLGFFVLKREQNTAYNNSIEDLAAKANAVKFPVKLLIWVGVSVLYVCMISPSIFTSIHFSHFDRTLKHVVMIAGIIIQYTGFTIEGIADRQKSAYKKSNPQKIYLGGLFRFIRYPNYFGEILFWSGNFIIAIPFLVFWWHWAIALAGLVCIWLIMLGSTKRLEIKQNQRYGDQPDYQAFIKNVPVLFPFIPVFSMKKAKFYLG